MAKVTVFVPGVLRYECGGESEIHLETNSVRDALRYLESDFPKLHRNVCDETGAVRRHISLFVNDLHIRDLQGIDSPLVSGDILYILTAVSGGASWLHVSS